MRFLPPVAALASGDVAFYGDDQAALRPLGTILEALRALGVAVDGGQACRSPCTARGRCAAGR